MTKRKRVITTNKEIYEKFSLLHFSPEVLLRNAKKRQVYTMIKNINKNNKILEMEHIGDYILVKKINPINFNIYFRKTK